MGYVTAEVLRVPSELCFSEYSMQDFHVQNSLNETCTCMTICLLGKKCFFTSPTREGEFKAKCLSQVTVLS